MNSIQQEHYPDRTVGKESDMNGQWFNFKQIALMCCLIIFMPLSACVIPIMNGKPSGPPSGVVEMDQNTDPRFFFRNQQDLIGYLKVAGKNVRLDGKKVTRKIRIQNGAHVTTGPASAAIIEFFPSLERECGIEVREFRYGRLYGLASQCGQIVITNQGAMETQDSLASYHVETYGGETVFTAIHGQAAVWLQSNPSLVVMVPSYHQVRLLPDQISTPRSVTPGEVASLTRWRENFKLYKQQEIEQDPIIFGPFLLDREMRRPRPTPTPNDWGGDTLDDRRVR